MQEENKTPKRHLGSDDGREEQLQRDGLLLGVVLMSLANGMQFSPFLDYVILPIDAIIKSIWGGTPILITFYLSSLALTSATFLLSGVPAALYEHAKGLSESSITSLAIWLAGAFLLALPSFLRLFQVI